MRTWKGDPEQEVRDPDNQSRTRLVLFQKYWPKNVDYSCRDSLGKSKSKADDRLISVTATSFLMNAFVTGTCSCCCLVAGLLGPKKYFLFKYLFLMSLDFSSLPSLSLWSILLNCSISTQHMRSILQTNLNRMFSSI